MFLCFVPDCSEKFFDSDSRKEHLMKFHEYSANYPFHEVIFPQNIHRNNLRDKINKQKTQHVMNTEQELDKTNRMVEEGSTPVEGKIPKNLTFGTPTGLFFMKSTTATATATAAATATATISTTTATATTTATTGAL
eukprot:TRINITY_DN7838_c0_g1_i1.p1 TRINITY_DN7838_c0_g1~~TRINITY_DN7838_c0_g1_i1.p1  ORF type:complete len:137 (-),score=55.58 TRINITY_DN7838_c0_g1_i1:93-503(-)